MGTIDFNQVNWYAGRASAAYQREAAIRQAYPDTVLVAVTAHSDVQYFLERDTTGQRQIISIRGTDNLRNALEDATYISSQNPKLGISVHRGFDEDASHIFQALLPQLNKSQQIILTGHSLGAAISTLLMMYLHEEGFKVGQSINFGQPKVTNHAGVEKYQFLPLLRVADGNDPVPLIPFSHLPDSIHGGYEHLGPELMLLDGQYYVYETQRREQQTSIDSFWKNLGNENIGAHHMKCYLQNIANKQNGAQQVPYGQREQYLKP